MDLPVPDDLLMLIWKIFHAMHEDTLESQYLVMAKSHEQSRGNESIEHSRVCHSKSVQSCV